MKQVVLLATLVFLSGLLAFESQAKPKLLKCLPGIKRFSKRDSQTNYYECGKNEEPILTQCEGNLVYNMRKQKCVTKDEQKKILPIDDKALGRNFQLGSMYDARTNMFFPEASLWSQDTINNTYFQYDRSNVNVDVTANKRTLDKTEHFEISAQLTLDFMSGMVHVSGSAGYLKDDVTSEEEVNVEMTYRTSKFARTIPKQIIKDYTAECSNPQFTHVVTSVTYGLDVVFVFKKLLKSNETEETITGSLEIAIHNIPGGDIEGSGNITITNADKEVMESTTLTMYGDFSPDETTPTTFEDAIDFYQRIPVFADEGSSIIEVHLTPITDVCTPEDFILNNLSEGMMAEVIKMLDELEQLDMKVTGLINSKQSQKFKPLRENLNLYRNALHSYELDIKMQLLTILPNIRGGTGHGEDDLVLMLSAHTVSQFYFETSAEFLIDRNREIQAIRFLEQNFPVESNIDIADYESANDVEYIFTRDLVVVLEFNILSSKDLTQSFLDGNRIDESDFWYNRVDINGHVGDLLRGLKQFGLENVDQDDKGYLVKVSPIKEQPYVMSALIKGSIRSDQYEVPHPPKGHVPYDITHENFRFSIPKYNEFTPGIRVYMTNMMNGDTYEEDKMFPVDAAAGSDVEIVMDGLIPANIYRFFVKYLTEVGTSPASIETKLFSTSPTSLPQSLTVEKVGSDTIMVTWQPPAVLATGIDVQELLYKLVVKEENGYEKVILTPDYDFTVMEPLDSTKYTFDVSVVIDRRLLEAPPGNHTSSTKLNLEMEVFEKSDVVTTSVFSNPLPPKLVPVNDAEVNLTSAVLRWDQPTNLAAGSTILHYVLEYTAVNENGDKAFSGTEGQLIGTETEIEMMDLSAGSVYAFKVKIVTSEGESDFSMDLMFMTKFDDEDLGQAREEVKSKIDDTEAFTKVKTSFCARTAATNVIGTILYDDVYLTDNNVNGAELNAGTGTFTAGAAGIYKVMVALEMLSDSDQFHSVWVVVNGEKMEESKIQYDYNLLSYGKGNDNGNRELMLILNPSDTITIEHDTNGDSGIMSVTFCVSSIDFTDRV